MQVPLVGGFYKAPSLLAGAQRCVNLFPEANQKDAPYPYTYYLTPGLRRLVTGTGRQWRGLYYATSGDLYGVLDDKVYYIDPHWTLTQLGTIGTTRGQVSFADNRLAIVLVDGSADGWVIDPFTKVMQQIAAPPFYGADRVRYIDTFFIFNRPGTNQFYSSLAEVTPAMLTGGPIVDGTITGGSGYASGLHANVALTGGTGSGGQADITVTAGVVTAVAVTLFGEEYRIGDVLTATASSLGGALSSGTIAGGSGYNDASYTNVPLTGGSGSGGIASVTVSGNTVTAVTITTAGNGYVVGDVLSADPSGLGGVGSGFTWTVTAVVSTGTGFAYTLTDVGSSSFDGTWIAAKSGSSDGLAMLEVVHKDIWLLGDLATSEVWTNVGGADYPFERAPGVFIEHACVAPQSVSKTDLFLFWLGRNREGELMAMSGQNYQALVISTPAVQQEWMSYDRIDDAVGFFYQQREHSFWVLTFPTADKTWAYDLKEGLWHERAWVDEVGSEHRIRANCMALAYGQVIVGDWENGKLYALDPEVFTDDGTRIVRRRGFPHLAAEGNLVTYQRLIANIEPGDAPGLLTEDAPYASLRWSDTRGQSWGNPITQTVGSGGQYDTYTTFWQLGSARDRVFELFWDFPYKTALQGAWIMPIRAST